MTTAPAGRPGDEADLPVLPGFRDMARRRGELLDALVERRIAAGLTQTEVAARMGTSQSSVARLESGAVDARLSTLERYAEVVGARIWGGPADREVGQ
jgi:predicted transcriptional regulator